MKIVIRYAFCLLFLVPVFAVAAPYPHVEGEALVQLRSAKEYRLKDGTLTYQLPSQTLKRLQSVGLESSLSLTSRPKASKANHEERAGAEPPPVFLLRFKSGTDILDVLSKLSNVPGVVSAEPNYVGSLCAVPPDEFYSTNQKEVLDSVGLEEAWDYSTGSPDVTIAILDSGIDTTHPEFSGRLLPGKNLLTGSNDVEDAIGHGTRVAGILGARGGDSGAGSGMTGVCWDCRILPLVVSATDSKVRVDTIVSALNYAYGQGADVINMSFALGANSRILEAACNAAAKSAVLVAAGGNQGQNFVPLYPAGYESVLGVASLDEAGNLSAFSNFNLSGSNEFLSLAAPGEGVFTTIRFGLYDGMRTAGTSFSAPMVSGVAALLRSLYPDQSPGAIRAHLERRARVSGTLVTKGVLDAGSALSTPMEGNLELSRISILDSTSLHSGNDRDSALDGGETVGLVIELQNVGGDLPSGSATLICSNPNVTIVTDTVSFPTLPNGELGQNLADPFGLQISASAPQSEASFELSIPNAPLVGFTLTIEDEELLPNTIAFDLTVGPTRTWMISGLTSVATEATLTVQPGTLLKFEEDARLEVYGGLSSQGTAGDRIQWRNETPPPESLFQPSREYNVGLNPESLIAADVTSDGVIDLVTTNALDPTVSILEGDGTGGFLPRQIFPAGSESSLVIPSTFLSNQKPLLAEDLSGDGVIDLMKACVNSNEIAVLLGDGDGGFLPQRRYSVGNNSPHSVIPADLTGDGVTDLLVIGTETSIFFGTGSGEFLLAGHLPVGGSSGAALNIAGDDAVDILLTNDNSVVVYPGSLTTGEFLSPINFPVGENATSLLAQDVTGDGVLDLVTANPQSGDVSLLRGDGSGGFYSEVRLAVGAVPQMVIATDVTGDSIPDLMTPNLLSDDVSLLEGDGFGGFLPQTRIAVGDGPRSLTTTDLLGDGLPEIVTVNANSNDLSVSFYDKTTKDFLAQQQFGVGDRPLSLLSADVTGDGLHDLTVANNNSGNVSVLAGPKGRGFRGSLVFATGFGPTSLAAEDLTGDGRVDVAVANTYSTYMSVLEGEGNGRLLTQATHAVSSVWHYLIAAGDITGDGTEDVIVTNSYRLSLFEGIGGGIFGPVQAIYELIGNTYFSSMVAADISGDGVKDIVIANNAWKTYPPPNAATTPIEGSITVLRSNGSGGFLIPFYRYTVGIDPSSIATADVTDDGVIDLVVSNFRSDDISVLVGTGSGAFMQGETYPTGDGPQSIVAVDITGDGKRDVVTSGAGGLTILIADASGGFAPPALVEISGTQSKIAGADLTGDGIMDLIALDRFADEVSVLVNNGSGNTFELRKFVVGDEPTSIGVADMNGDAITDVIVSNYADNTVSILLNDGNGYLFSGEPTLLCFGSSVNVSFNDFQLPGAVALDNGGSVSESSLRDSGAGGLILRGAGTVSNCTSVNCAGFGFDMREAVSPPVGLAAIENRGVGMRVPSALDSTARGNDGAGIVADGSIENCVAERNDGNGLVAGETVVDSSSTQNNGDGIVARVVENCLSGGNGGYGIRALDRVVDSLIIGNADGVEAPVLEGSIVIGTFGPALANATRVNDSALLENVSISSDRIQFNKTTLAGNAESATIEEIDGMYVAGNEGGGVRGIPVFNSTIIGNKGPGVDQNVTVSDSNVIFNEGPGVVGGSVANAYVIGNREGDLTEGAAGVLSSVPVESAPAFLADVRIDLATLTLAPTQSLSVGRAEFILTYSKDMDTNRWLWVTFGQSSPFTSFVVAASPGWSDERTWKGFYDIGGEVGSGRHTLRVSGARSLPDLLFPAGFEIPPDTYHGFLVDTEGGLSLNNGRIVLRTDNALTLAWDPSTDVTPLGFSILRSRTGRIFTPVAYLQGTHTDFTDEGLDPGTRYFYQVYESISPNQYRELTRPFSGATDAAVPTPTETATANSPSTFTPTSTTTPSLSLTPTGIDMPETYTPTASPIFTPTVTETSNYDVGPNGTPDGKVNSHDLLALLHGSSPLESTWSTLFDFSRFWVGP